MTSLQIGIKFQSGGEGRVFSELLRTLPQAGCVFEGLVAGPIDVAQSTDGMVHAFAGANASLFARFQGVRHSFRSILRRRRPSVIATHFALYAFPVSNIAVDIPRITHFHGPWADESAAEGASSYASRAKFLLEQFVYRRAAHTIVLSRAFARLAADRYGIPPESITVIPGSVDLKRFNIINSKHAARAMLGLPQNRRILVSVRRLVHRMGLIALVEAVPDIIHRYPDMLLVIAGQGPLESSLKERVRVLGLGASVRFLGFVPDNDLPMLYRAADINVVPTSQLEGFGLVAAEALACGTPSMVTPVGGLPEVVEPLAKSLVLPSIDKAGIAKGLIDAFDGVTPLPSSEDCHGYATRAFDPALMAERTCDVYRRVLNTHK